jgi:site-specific DNA-methyltransferase (adenine-specific)
MKSVWRISAPAAAEKKFGKHPTQKPIALVERCLLASTHAGDIILDPFSGGGTTAVASIKTGRHCLGIELETKHIEMSSRRFQHMLDPQSANHATS